MCGCNADDPGEVPGSPPGGTTGGTGLCCACPASDTISQNGNGTYFTTTDYPMPSIVNKCEIDIVRTATDGTVTLTKSFDLSTANLGTALTDTAAKATATSAIASAMSNWTSGASAYKVKIEQPGCDPQELTMVFRSSIVASGGDVAVTVDGSTPPPRPTFVSGGVRMTIFLNGSGSVSWTMTHEVGHTFGLPDEYAEILGVPIVPPPTTPGAPTITPPSVSPTTTYIGAPPQANVTFPLTPRRVSPRRPTKYLFDNPSVMGRDGNTTYPMNLFFWVAIEVKKILAAEGAPSTVTIV
ncbi:hypothetical protein BCF46_0617 [Litoreibacter meonggei]|uniref:Uncharacterized protein n=1 Tax=Litoreibacter meonggei TaxID=1049199 RepID=A0A497X565_9RHOB|nr:hypothetical protein [Litoreibacter meonggei]RLJ60418.1 hypothetical protein BCF46_0617 [Litoreibacter meonggei]